jgi:hypothetical protein
MHRALPLAALLLVGCAHALVHTQPSPRARWITLYREQPKRNWGYNLFLDTLAVHRVADTAYVVWIIAQYDTALVDDHGDRYRTVAALARLNCHEGTLFPIKTVELDSTPVRQYNHSPDPDSIRAAAAGFKPPLGSVMHAIWHTTCAALQHEPWTFDAE